MSKKHTNIWLPKLNYYSKRLSMWQEKFWRDVTGKPFMGIIDNVTGRRVFEFATFGRSGVQQANSKLFRLTKNKQSIIQKSVSAFPYGTVSAAGVSDEAALTTQIDRGQRSYDADSMQTYYLWGFAGDANNFHSATAFGTMDDVTYTDGSSTSRTIRSMYDADGGGSPGGGDLFFSIDGTSVPNTDATFIDITWDNTAGTPITVDRSVDFTSYTASQNGDTGWRDLTPSSDWTDGDLNTDFVLTTS